MFSGFQPRPDIVRYLDIAVRRVQNTVACENQSLILAGTTQRTMIGPRQRTKIPHLRRGVLQFTTAVLCTPPFTLTSNADMWYWTP